MGRTILLSILTILGIVVSGIIAVYYVPVSWTLGPCMKDWTSPSTYRHRSSPLEKVRFPLGGGAVQICYSRPQARGRKVFGNLVKPGRYWRTGANEPARLYTSVPLTIAGIDLEPGRYSFYTFPGDTLWEFAVNTSTFHWGIPFTEALEQTEIDRGVVQPETMDNLVDTFTIRPGRSVGDRLSLLLEWEHTRVAVPVRLRSH